MKTIIKFWLIAFLLVSTFSSSLVGAAPVDKKKSAAPNGVNQHDYEEAVKALKDQIFLVSIYSFVDKVGTVAGIEPEGNFINVNKDTFIMQKSVALALSTFAGSDHMKGQITDFQLKENKKGNIQFSFVISEGDKVLVFKAKMNKGNNIIEGSIKGKKEDSEVPVSGNVQPVKSHFDY
jgi:hypothetical protein